MKKQPPNKVASAWAALLQDSVKDRGTSPEGEGWLTFDELREIFPKKMGANALHKFLKAESIAGRVETFRGLAPNEQGRLCQKHWYRIKTS